MRRVLALALLTALVLASVGGTPSVARAASDAPGDLAAAPHAAALDGSVRAQQRTADWRGRTELRVQLRASRDARWRVVTSYRLDTENDTAAFRRYGAAFERGEATGAVRAALFERLANASESVAGREMAIRNVTRTAEVDGDTGRLVLAFTWTNFLGRTDGNLLVLRDALLLPGGDTWLSTLQADQRLVIETPPEYTINYTSTQLVLQSNAVIIDGPRSFDAPLTVRYRPSQTESPPPPPNGQRFPWELLAGGALALVIVVVVVLRRRDTGVPAPAESGSDSPLAGGAERPPPEASDETAPGGATGGETDAAEEDVDLSLLSDAERVEHLLERNDGRMRQAKIVEETGWSDAKVSQLLSSMAEEGRVEKLRLGRENLISLPEESED